MNKLLFPLSVIYYFVTAGRNLLYNKKVLKVNTFDIPIICVGNLSTGGTGKTPMMIYLIDLLKSHYKIATLSRGYGRKTRGYKWANYQSTFMDVGDEPLMFFKRHRNSIVVSVGEDRAAAIAALKKDFSPQVILLDDAFQHRSVKAGLNILLTDFSRPYFNDYVLPMGRLREPRTGIKRADIIVVTKCPPHLSDKDRDTYIRKIKPLPHQKVFFSHIYYDRQLVQGEQFLPVEILHEKNVLLITGIAKGNDLKDKVLEYAKTCSHLSFSDHHAFNYNEIQNILEKYDSLPDEKILLTTEKDYMRLCQFPELVPILYYWPISTWIENHGLFDKEVLGFVSKHVANT